MMDTNLAYRAAVIGLRIISGDNVTSAARRTLRGNLGRLDPDVRDALAERITSTTYADLGPLIAAGTNTADVAGATAGRPDVVTILAPRPGLDRMAPERFAAVALALGVAYLHVESLTERATVTA